MRNTAVVVDDHPMCRHATAMALQVADPDLMIIEAASLAEAREHAPSAALITLDLALPDATGVLSLPAFRQEYPTVPLLVISGATNPAIERQVAASGAQGYLSKGARISEMIEAMRSILSAGTWFSADVDLRDGDSEFGLVACLTSAQSRVLRAMEGGRLNKQVAYDLGLSEITVKAHVKAILKKLAVPNRTQAILMLRRVES